MINAQVEFLEGIEWPPPIDMPILEPIPIKTKGLPWWKAIMAWLTEPRRWVVREDWGFTLPDRTRILIPEGFIFDGASIPRLLWWLFSPVGILLIPALIHDYAYASNFLLVQGQRLYRPIGPKTDRAKWDLLFREVAIYVNGFEWLNYGPWLGLMLFGGRAWNKHRRPE